LLTGVALVLLWAVPAGQAGGEAYRQDIFWGQSAGRVVDAFAHRSPWWSYLLWLPLMWLPWLLWPPLWRGLRRLSFADPGLRFCLAVWLPALLLFSLISGKQPKYLLPLLPLLAVLMARLLAETQASAYLGTRTLAVLLAALGLLLTVLPWWPHGPDWLEDVQCWWGAALVLSALVFFRLRWRRNQAVRVMVLGVWLGTASLYLGIIAPLAPRYGVQALSSQLAELQSAGRPLAWLGKYHGQFQFAGRLTSRIQPLAGGEQLRNWLAAHVDGYVLVNYRTEGVALPADLLSYPYRSGKLVLWPAQRLLDLPAQLDALAGNA
jgi:4-amino-4-deoxy-L-arabinose transferase-like glycosyltransferase